MDAFASDGETLEFPPFRLDPRRRVLTLAGEAVPLTPTVFDALTVLARNAGRVVTKDDMIEAVWAGRMVGDSTISQTIFSLRKSLAAAGASDQLIATVSGKGYRLVVPVRRETDRDTGAEPASRAAPPPPPAPLSSWRRPAVLWGLAALASMAVAVALSVLVAARPWAATRRGPPDVVVQAHFQNRTGDAMFDRTLAKVVEIDLGQSPRLEVLSDRQVDDTLVQMLRPRDALLDGALAREVCLRNNGRAVVEGALEPLGRRYLITLMATDCTSGGRLSAEKRIARDRDAVIPTLESLIRQTRRKLGEPAGSVRRFDTPLLQGRTGSLAALQAFSEAVRLANRGQISEAIALQRHAVDLDPGFAAAHLELARALFNTGQFVESRAEMTRAFQLREAANADLRYAIEILYYVIVDLDYRKALDLAKAATEVFPDHLIGWGQQANLDLQLGLYDDAIVAARRELALDPGREVAYHRLADGLLAEGRYGEASTICRDAAVHGAAGGLIAADLAQVALARQDVAALETAVSDAQGKPWEADVVTYAALGAYASGQLRHGNDLFDRARSLYAAAGQDGYFIGYQAGGLALAGEPDAAIRLLAHVPIESQVTSLSKINALYALSETGQAVRAGSLLDALLKAGPADTTLGMLFAPAARAALALAQGRPGEALADLAPAAVYEARDNTAPYLRGRIDLALRDGAGAAREFHKVVDHPGIDPWDMRHALAWLGLARAEALQTHYAASRRDYERFLDLWRHADADVPILIAARRELRNLPTA